MLKNILTKIAHWQTDHPKVMMTIILLFTIVMAIGMPNLKVQSDFSKESPRQLPAYVLTDRINDEFGGENAVVLLFEVENSDENKLIDLKSPEIFNSLSQIETVLKTDSRVIKTSSIGGITAPYNIQSKEQINYMFKKVPELNGLFSEDSRMTILTITTSIGGSYEEVVPFLEMVDEKIKSVGLPGGVKYTATGGPPFGKVVQDTVFSDALKTMIMASIGIFLLLYFTEKSLKKAILIFVPLIFALIWTIGIIGFIGDKISIASVALSSIILGLGVEYGVFMLTRYNEERKINKLKQRKANENTVVNIGTALLSSGTTTVAGFLALTFSISPTMQGLGLNLGIGITSCILTAIFVAPLLIVLEENWEKFELNKILDKKNKRREFLNN